MIPRPRVLLVTIVASAIVMIATGIKAYDTCCFEGILFWIAMAVFAFCFHKLDKYESYYDKCSDDELS